MRILYIARLFSGLETSLAEGRWNPTGVPAVYKVIEALDRSGHEPLFVFTAKDFGSDWSDARDRTIAVEGLRHPVHVLAGEARASLAPAKAARYLRELHQSRGLRRLAKTFAPDLIYVGNANVWTGAWLARHTAAPVIFRVMGVYPAMRQALAGRRLADRVLRWSYRAPFAAAVVTQDGSGVEPWLEAGLDPRVPRHLLINGVDLEARPVAPHPALASLPPERTKLLFIGRLEPHKGGDVFIEAFLRAWRREPSGLHAVVIGAGEQLAGLREHVRGAGADACATFIERLPHAQVLEAHARTDIYVSLNRYGNLSNANLEAMKSGQCMIFPAAQPATGVDLATDRLIPPGAALRIPSADAVEALADAILDLHRRPDRRAAMRAALSRAVGFIPSWDERIAAELGILEEAADRRRSAA